MPGPDEEKRICLGAFAGAHGVKGDAIVKTFTEAPENISAYGPVTTEDGARSFTFRFIRHGKPGFAIVTAPEIRSREDAEALKGVRVYVARDALPETDDDEFYLDDLVGLPAFDEKGGAVGAVVAVHNFGAGDIIELGDIPDMRGSRMIPFTKDAVPDVDIAGRRLTIARAALDEANAPASTDDN